MAVENKFLKTKKEKIENFDPSGVGNTNGGIFSLPFTAEEAEIVLIPVPWEVTVSYLAGTAQGPEAIYKASIQLDLFDPYIPEAWKLGIAMELIPEDIINISTELRHKTQNYIAWLEGGGNSLPKTIVDELLTSVNTESIKLVKRVKEKSLKYLKAGKAVGVIGGDHSTPLGLIHALAEIHDEFGILQIDAHADLRDAYEGFEYSHASIMFNALKLKEVKKLVQVGIRDIGESEAEIVRLSNGRITTFYDESIKEAKFAGTKWKKQCKKMVAQLPQKVYVSFDIDGLDPKLCPGTGTPVAGGLEFWEAVFLIKCLVTSGREIIGFDLCEVAPGDSEWNGNVGARLLYKLCNWMAVSQKKLNSCLDE